MVKGVVAETLDMEVENVTRSFVFMLGTFLLYLSMMAIEFVPFPFDLGLSVLFLVFWLGYPFALHFDKKYVSRESDWTPSKWYYLGFLPGYLGIFAVIIYIRKRKNLNFKAEEGSSSLPLGK